MQEEEKQHRFRGLWKIILIILGLALLAYPIIAERMSAHQADEMINSYIDYTQSKEDKENEEWIQQALIYNALIAGHADEYPNAHIDERELFTPPGFPFAYLEIPVLKEQLPIYHGTDADSLQAGVGHLEGTSIPVGGDTCHAALAGHSGMPGSRMFDDIDRLVPGDVFIIHIKGETLAYQVYGSEVVLPEEAETLQLEEGRDLCTLITCTPYGINDHRLLVHAERIDYSEDLSMPDNIDNAAMWLNHRTIPFIIGILLTLLTLIIVLVRRRKDKKEEEAEAAAIAAGEGYEDVELFLS